MKVPATRLLWCTIAKTQVFVQRCVDKTRDLECSKVLEHKKQSKSTQVMHQHMMLHKLKNHGAIVELGTGVQVLVEIVRCFTASNGIILQIVLEAYMRENVLLVL